MRLVSVKGMVCTVDGCERPVLSSGRCVKHHAAEMYRRKRARQALEVPA